MSRCVALTFSNGLFQFRNRESDFQINVAIRTEITLQLVFKFQVHRDGFHGEEAGARKDGKVE